MDDQKALDLSLEYSNVVQSSDRWSDFIERSKRGSDYYVGLQTYAAEVRARLEREGKSCLVFNEILPVINYLTSVERDNRKDAKVVERRGGYACVAELLTEMFKHMMDSCGGDYVKSDVFLNGVKSCMGWFSLEVDYDSDPVTGQIILRSRPTLAVRSDPACMSYDLNDPKNGAQFIIDSDFELKSKLKAQYPKKADDIDSAVNDYVGGQGRGLVKRLVDYVVGNTVDDIEDSEVLFDTDLMAKWRCRVQTTWMKEYVSRTLVCDKRNWEVRWLNPKKKSEWAQLQQLKLVANQYPQAFEIKEKTPMPLMHKVVRIGQLLLDNVEDPYNGMSMFPLIPYSPFGEAQYDMGVVDNLIGPQDELNKRMTNAVHILNQTANGGMVIGKETSAGYLRVLRDFGSSPNMVVELDKCGGHWEKIEPNQLSQGHMQLQATDKNYIEEISSVSGSSRGYDPSRQESGRLYREKVKQSMATNQIIYDRFDHTCRIMSYTAIGMIRHTQTYTEQEIGYMVTDKDLVAGDLLEKARKAIVEQQPPPPSPLENPMFIQLAPENQQFIYKKYEKLLEEYTAQAEAMAIKQGKEELFEQLKAYRTGKYSVTVIQSPNAPTTQISNFYELEALKDLVPPEILGKYMILATGLPKEQKDEMVEKLEAITQAASRAQPA